jgi:NAD(P)-dependent dehydrogenase (short-subunit alcohol dehydrogenase family)
MIKANTHGGQITLIEMDNESLASVKRAANEFLKRSKTLHVLINNAGSVNL